jgi:hypothetical protein
MVVVSNPFKASLWKLARLGAEITEGNDMAHLFCNVTT